ncbi:hypothetical protein HUU51_00845 [Candidatus Gracilibacteria bacterium]|nr:hypothetical protein [Candidatus Gracilibacteria bacterium]
MSKKNSIIKEFLSKIKIHLDKKVDFQNKYWYVLIALLSSILGLLLGLYTLIVPISNILSNVDTLTKNINELKYNYTDIYNPQDINTNKLTGGEIVEQYINLLNKGDYQNACSLISTLQCTMFDVKGFTNWVGDKKRYLTVKLKDGEKLIKTWESGEKLENTNTEVWCGEIEYYMNTEDRPIKEIRQFSILTRPDGKKEIGKIISEKAEKLMQNGEYQDRTKQMFGYITENKICSK